MLDDEAETLMRAEDEYSEDPHYSIKVTMSSLQSDLASLMVNRRTLFKVIGRNSKDGNSMSGYSGTSLAFHMITLGQVSLFSISGNVSRTFTRDFFRVFTRSGYINAVLETTVQNNHVYQIMTDTNACVEYQVSKRHVDHSTQYDTQQIVIMEDDPVVRNAATFLYEKHPTVTSVYMLDNQRAKLIKGDSGPLSAESRLVLVGHGEKGNDGEMRLSGYNAKEVAAIVEQLNIEENQIKTTSVVACDVGSDEAFRNTLFKELHARSINTELHLRNSLLEVSQSGQKHSAEMTPRGLVWKHGDGGKKIILKMNRNGEVVTQIQTTTHAEETFLNERNILGDYFKQSWPIKPGRFVSANARMTHTDDLEALAWAFFQHGRQGLENKMQQMKHKTKSTDKYELYDLQLTWSKKHKTSIREGRWLTQSEIDVSNRNCYEINSGEDVMNVITHYASVGENIPTYLMLNDWIYHIDQSSLYVYPVGKRLTNNDNANDIQKAIQEQFTERDSIKMYKCTYKHMRDGINRCGGTKELYAKYARDSLKGAYKNSVKSPELEAWFTTMFLASVIAESARNFRSFPVALMAMDMSLSQNPQTEQKGLDFLWELPMAKGKTWINKEYRGFHGASMESLYKDLKAVTSAEDNIVEQWFSYYGEQKVESEIVTNILQLVHGDNLNKENSKTDTFMTSYQEFIEGIKSNPTSSGVLGGSHDGAATLQDVHSAADVESSLKLSSHYSRSAHTLSEQIRSELHTTFGSKAQELHVKPDSVMIQDGQFHCELFNKETNEIIKWKLQLPEEGRIHMENILNSMEKFPERFTPHTAYEHSEHWQHAGMGIGITGLLLGVHGAVRAFEHGDIKTGVVASLQVGHGVMGMSLAAVGKHVSIAAEGKVVNTITKMFKNPIAKRTLAVFPVVGIGFGIYNIIEDIKRNDTLGKIDAVLDALIVLLDVVELVAPELFPVNLVLNSIRLGFDYLYLGIQEELNTLPADATVFNKIGACFLGVLKGVFRFMFAVASFFLYIPYEEIENGHRLVESISNYHDYYSTTEMQHGRKAISFTDGKSSNNGGGITFSLSDDREVCSKLCMDYFVSAINESPHKECWEIDTSQTDDIILGIGESHQLTYSNVEIKIFFFIPVRSVRVVSGYETLKESRYGQYSGNKNNNTFFAVQKVDDKQEMEVMLSYSYKLYGKAGKDTFYLGPQRSYVEGQGDTDTYIIPKDGGNTIINNYDPDKAKDLLILSINYEQISVVKCEDHVILKFSGNNHYVEITHWFLSDVYRHMNLMSADGVIFDIPTAVFSGVKLVARGVNLMSKSEGQTVDSTQPLLLSVTNIMGSPHNDRLIGNAQKNMINGGGGQDYMKGGEEEDIYVVNEEKHCRVQIENFSRDKAMDILIIEAKLHAFKIKVEEDNLILIPFGDDSRVTLINWFRSNEYRHMLIITKDLISFSLSADKSLCRKSDPIHSKCIISQSVDYSESQNALIIDLEKDEAFMNVTYVHGSNLNDDIRANAQENTLIAGSGTDFLQGRGGRDLYMVTPGYGRKTIDNFSPDLALDTLFLKADYGSITVKCFGSDLTLLVNGIVEVQLKSWFTSKMSQHLQVHTQDGIIFNLKSDVNKCMEHLKLPQSVDYRNRTPSQRMDMSTGEFVSVVEMYGSPGYDIMTGNDKDNRLDPFTGGGIMTGGEGTDTYIIKPEYGTQTEINNFADDEKEDTVMFPAEFLSNLFTVDLENEDLIISANIKGQNVSIRFYNYIAGQKHQHLHFQSADGVYFRVTSPITNQPEVLKDPWIKAFKVILQDKSSDCYLDLSHQRNLSTVSTVRGCSHQSNHIQGNDEDNALFGGMKHDVLDGGDGHDVLFGGQGDDILLGSSGNDTLYGEDGDDTLLGGSGWDTFIPGTGADMMDGGPGRDTVLYQGDHEKGEGVYVSLLSGEGHHADAEGDVLKDMENVIGTIYSDILVSGFEPALLKGSDGDDVLVSVEDGDYLIGGEGRDVYMVVPHRGLITIDNCSEDEAMDVLYLPSVTKGFAECRESSSGLYLKFPLFNNTYIDIFLKDWVNNNHKCGHLTVIMPEVIANAEK